MMGGGVGVRDNVTIGSGAKIAGASGRQQRRSRRRDVGRFSGDAGSKRGSGSEGRSIGSMRDLPPMSATRSEDASDG